MNTNRMLNNLKTIVDPNDKLKTEQLETLNL